MPYDDISWWYASAPREPRDPLPGDVDADVAIVGAGFTGLWTAYYLKRADPGLRVCVLEREVVGFGASGRNGGWCVGSMAAAPRAHERRQTGGALRMARAIQQTVDEVGEVAQKEAIDCHFQKGGTIYPAVNPPQLASLTERARLAWDLGMDESDYRLLPARETLDILNIPGVHGGLYTPHCAALQPYRLAAGLADTASRLGVDLYEQTAVSRIGPRRVDTAHGTVRAEVVVRATEAYTGSLDGHARKLIPIYNHMVVTEPLPPAFWDEVGLERRETFEDARRVIYYGQRTADDRIAIGGLAAEYAFRSRIDRGRELRHAAHRRLERLLRQLFPALERTRIAQRWGGVLAVPRDWYPSVGYDRVSGHAWAGGYVGQGVAASNLAGRTLTDLIRGEDSELTALPWVNHRSPDWEPEPARWLGARATTALLTAADWADDHGHGGAGRAGQRLARWIGLA